MSLVLEADDEGNAFRFDRHCRRAGDDGPDCHGVGPPIEDAAQHLCRSGTIDGVRRNAEGLGVSYKTKATTSLCTIRVLTQS